GSSREMYAEVRRWNVATGELLGAPLPCHEVVEPWPLPPALRDAPALNANASSRAVPATNPATILQQWDLLTGKPVGQPLRQPGNARLQRVDFGAGGKVLQTRSYDEGERKHYVSLWDPIMGQPLGSPYQDVNPVAAVSPDGTTFLAYGGTQSGKRPLYLVERATGKRIGSPLADDGYNTRAVFSHDGRAVLTAGGGKLQWWDRSTGAPLAPPLACELFRSQTFGPLFLSPDGKTLLVRTSSHAGTKGACYMDTATGNT